MGRAGVSQFKEGGQMPVEARAMKDLKGFLTPEQVEAMIKSCDNLRDRAKVV